MNWDGDGVAEANAERTICKIPVNRGPVLVPFGCVRGCFMIIMLPWKDPRPAGVRAARVRCGRSSLCGVSGR